MEGDPYVLIEGMTIAGFAVGAEQATSTCAPSIRTPSAMLERGDRTSARRRLSRRDILGSGRRFDLEVRRGAGAYICGEETSLLESLEGKRGMVRYKPPLPAIQGLFGKPTVVNNVITLASVPIILDRGAEFYRDYGMGRSRGTLPIQLAGNVKRGGLVEKAFGVTLRELLYDFGGGSATGRADSRRAGRRPARRLSARIAVRHAARLRGLRRPRRDGRPRRDRRVRRHGRHGEDGALRDGVLRHRVVRQMHAVPHRLHARRRGDGQDHARR